MGYNNNRRNGAYGRRSSRPGSRWMNLRYAGVCKVCGVDIPAGARAYWDGAAKTVTCTRDDCMLADGIAEVTDRSPWLPSGRVRARERRIGDGVQAIHENVRRAKPQSYVTTFNSGASVYVNRNGRCEDAPCCGCCS
jgi:hypothetical protein